MGAKLVRDRIGDIPWQDEDAKAALRPVTSRDEHRRLLLMKLLEEVGEFVASTTSEERLAEAADILEVLTAFLEVCDGLLYPLLRVTEVAKDKYTERGGFEIGTVWEGTAIR